MSSRPLLTTFLPSLNALLAALDLPFSLDDPTDLTPSLLLAIFESLISARLPIPPSIRQSRTRDAKSRAMLVLLGVLECDILRGGIDAHTDHSVATSNIDDSVLAGAGGVSVDGWADEIGLGEVDPERLADGGWEETIFIGELLCWLARRKGILPRTKSAHRASRSLYSNHHSYGDEGDSVDLSTSLLLRPSPAQSTRSPRPPSPSVPDTDPDFSALSHITDVPRHPLVHSPEPSFSASATSGTDLSIRARSVSSRTTMSNAHDHFDEASQDTVQMYDPRQMMQDAEDDDDRPPTFRPRCIHELEDPSYIRALTSFDPSTSEDPSRDQDIDDPYAPPTPTPRRVRLTVDPATELDHFAASRSRAFNPSTSSRPRPKSGASRTPRRISPSPSPPARSPPSSPESTHSDPPFDISFSTLNNTSTPAKPRPSRRPRTRTRSPPSFSTSGRLGGTMTGGGANAKKSAVSPPVAASTAMTNTLLTERARLLTELAALKRARAVSGAGGSSGVGHRVDVGV